MKIYIVLFILLIMAGWTIAPENDVYRYDAVSKDGMSLTDGRKPDLDVSDFGFTEQEVKHLINGRNKSKFMCAENCKILLNGSTHNIKDMKSGELMGYIWAIDKMNLSKTTKVAIWDVIKGDKPCKEIKPKFLRQIKSLVLSIPDPDLYQLNMSSIEMVKFLGKVKGFNRRQLGVLAYSMKNTLGENVIRSATILNQINGLLCGFPPQSLEKIAPKIFLNVNKTVFKHISSCTSRQLKVLIEHAKSHEAYGPTSSWSSDHVSNLGLLITGLTLEDIRQLRPRGIAGIPPSVIEAMSLEQLEGMNLLQLGAMKDDTLSAYRRKTGVTNSQSRSAVPSRCLLIMFLFFIYHFDNIVGIKSYDFSVYRNGKPYETPTNKTESFIGHLLGLLATLLYAPCVCYVYWLYKKYVKLVSKFEPYHLINELELTVAEIVKYEDVEEVFNDLMDYFCNHQILFLLQNQPGIFLFGLNRAPKAGMKDIVATLDDFWPTTAKPLLEPIVRIRVSVPLWTERRYHLLTYPLQQLFDYEEFCHNVEIAIENQMRSCFDGIVVSMVEYLYAGEVPSTVRRAHPKLKWS